MKERVALLCEELADFAENVETILKSSPERPQCLNAARKTRAISKWIRRQTDFLTYAERDTFCIAYDTLSRQLDLAADQALTLDSALQGYRMVTHLASNNSALGGRPRVVIEEAWLREAILVHNLSLARIGRILALDTRTVQREVQQYQITGPATALRTYSDFTPAELRALLSKIRDHYPDMGYPLIDGLLRSEGLVVRKKCIQDILQDLNAATEIDPVHSFRNFRMSLPRIYQVHGPNSLWHRDGQHGLVKDGIIIDGIIDGDSRFIVSLQAVNNNRSDTMLDCFVNAVGSFGLPSRVRGDRGGENVGIAAYMERTRGTSRGSFLWGP